MRKPLWLKFESQRFCFVRLFKKAVFLLTGSKLFILLQARTVDVFKGLFCVLDVAHLKLMWKKKLMQMLLNARCGALKGSRWEAECRVLRKGQNLRSVPQKQPQLCDIRLVLG